MWREMQGLLSQAVETRDPCLEGLWVLREAHASAWGSPPVTVGVGAAQRMLLHVGAATTGAVAGCRCCGLWLCPLGLQEERHQAADCLQACQHRAAVPHSRPAQVSSSARASLTVR